MQVEVSDELFRRAQALAIPLVDTFETVVSKGLALLEQGQNSSIVGAPPIEQYVEFRPYAPPILTHTKLDSCVFEGERLPNYLLYWNHLMRLALARAVSKGYTGMRLLTLVVVPAVPGEKTDEGFSYYPDAGISIQGQDSIGAWKQTAHFAKALGLQLEVKFHWTENPKSPHPGEKGMFRIE